MSDLLTRPKPSVRPTCAHTCWIIISRGVSRARVNALVLASSSRRVAMDPLLSEKEWPAEATSARRLGTASASVGATADMISGFDMAAMKFGGKYSECWMKGESPLKCVVFWSDAACVRCRSYKRNRPENRIWLVGDRSLMEMKDSGAPFLCIDRTGSCKLAPVELPCRIILVTGIKPYPSSTILVSK